MLTAKELRDHYFAGDGEKLMKTVSAVIDRMGDNPPSEGGFVMTMQEHAALYALVVANAEMLKERDDKLAAIGRIVGADTLEEAMVEITAEKLAWLMRD